MDKFAKTLRRLRLLRGKRVTFLALLATFLGASTGLAATITTAGNGNWNSITVNAPWPGGTVPATTDDVIIRAGDSVTVTADVTINSVAFNNASITAATLTVNGTFVLTVTAGITLQNSATIATSSTIAGAGTINCASVTVGGTTVPTAASTIACTLTATISTLSISGSLTARSQRPSVGKINNATFALGSGAMSVANSVVLNADTTATATLTLGTAPQTGTLTLSGPTPFSTPGVGTATFTANGTGATVVYSGAAQTIRPVTYQHLTLSGSGAKTMTGVGTISGNLTVSGMATAATAIALVISGNLDVGTGTTFTVAGFNITVTGTTSVTGTLTHSSLTGAKTYTGDVTINTGGIWNETAAAAISFAGNLQNDGTLTASTGVHTFTGAAKTLSGASGISIPSLTITGTYTSTGTLTVGTALAGAGTLTQGPSATLNLGGTSAITTLTATASPNLVNYTGAAQTVKATSYNNLTLSGSGAKTLTAVGTIAGNLTLSGTASATTAIALVISGNLDVGTGTTFTVGAFVITVTGTSSVTGTLTHSSLTGAKTYTGNVTINSGGIWNETAAAAISFAGNLQNDGTLTASTGVHTFTGAAKNLSGANVISIPSVTISGTYSNNGTLTVGTALAGAGTLTQGTSATLNIGGTSTVTGLTATASPNTVNYTGAAQTVKATSYHHLIVSGSNTKTLAGTITVAGDLSVSAGTLDLSTFTADRTIAGGTLTLASGSALKIGGTGTFPSNYTTHSIDPASTIEYSGTTQTVAILNSAQNYGNLIISGSAIKSLVASIGVAGNLTVSAGTLDLATFTADRTAAGGTLTLSGGTSVLKIGGTGTFPSNYTTHSINAASTIEYYGGGQTVVALNSAQNYGNLIFSGNGDKAMPGSAVTISGSLTLSGTATATTAAALTISGNLAVGTGTTFTVAGFNITVTGTTSVTGTLTHSSLTGAKTHTGNVTINTGGIWNETAAAAISFAGNLQNDGTLTASTGVHTFTGAAKTLSGANGISIPSLTITGTYTSTGTLTVGTALAGAGTLTQGASATLNLGGTSAITTLTATASPNLVNYTGAAQTVKATSYNNLTLSGSGAKTLTAVGTIAGNLTLSGTASATTAIALVISGNLDVGTGTTFTVGAFVITVTGTSSVTGTLTHSSLTGAKTYTGNVTINSGGIWNETAAAAISFAGNLQNDGTLTASTGVHTFTGAAKNLSGANVISIPSVTISGTYSNNGTLTVGTALAGAGTLTQGTSATLNIGGTSTVTGLTATASPNTVNYTGAAQTVKATSYHHLIVSGSNTKTLAGTITVAGDLSVSAGTLDLSTFTADRTIAGGTLTLASGSALKIGGTGTFPSNYTTHSIDPASTIEYSGTTQTVAILNSAQNYGNLIISGSAIKSLVASIGVAGNLTVSAGTLDLATFTADRTAAGGTLTLSGGTSVLKIGGTGTFPSNYTTHSINAASTIEYYGGGQTVVALNSAQNYGNLIFSGNGDKAMPGSAVTISGSLTLSGTATATTAAALTISGNLAVGTGTTFTVAGFNITVTGTTSVTGTLTHSSLTGAKTHTGNVTINTGGIWNETAAAAISFAGNLQNDGTLTASTGVHTFTGAAKTLSGASGISIPSLTITGTYTSTGTLTVGTALAGAGTLTQGASATLNLGGTSAITTLTATASPNLVNYTGAAQTVKATSYNNLTLSGSGAKTLTAVGTIAGNLTLSGTVTATTAIALVISGNLDVGTGTTFTVGAFVITVTGTSSVTGTLTHSSLTGAKTYTGNVTINSGGIWNETAAAAISFAGNLQNDGTLTASTGVHTFTGAAKNLSGANAISIPSVTISGTYSNNGTLTVGTALAGAGTLTQGTSATLNLGGTSAITTLTATASPNLVNYNGAAQTVKATSYNNLTLSGSGAKTMTSVATIAGNLTLSGTATMTGNGSFIVGGALAYSSSGSTTLSASTPISIGSFNQTLGTLVDNANTITVTGTGAGTWSKSAGTFTATGMAKFTGAAPQIGTFSFNNLEINVGAANTASLTGSVNVGGTLTLTDGTLSNGTNLTLGNGATISRATGTLAAAPTFGTTVNVTYAGTTGVTSGNELPSSTSVLNNLTLNYSSTATLTLNADRTLNGLLTIGANSTLADAGMTLTAKGNVSNAGTHGGVGKVLLTGGSAAHVMSGAGAFSNLELDDSNGATLSGSPTINGTLTLTTGKITTGANILIVATGGSISGAGSTAYVVGNLRKMFPIGSPLSFTFPIGDASNYTPADLANLTVSTAGHITASVNGGGEHPDIANSGIDATRDVNRYWTLAGAGGLVAANYDATFHFVVGDLDAGVDFNNFIVKSFNPIGSTWSVPTTSTLTATSAQATSLSSFGDFAIGERQIHHYIVAAVSPQTAGVAFFTTVTAQDEFNQTVTNSSTVVTMSGTGVQFDSNGDSTFGDNTKTLVNGSFTISTKDNLAQTITITATDGNGKTGTSGNVAVSPAAANKLTIQTQPSTTTTAGVVFAQQPIIRIEDQFGNLIMSDNSTIVTAARSSGTGTLQGTLTGTASSGVATFSGLNHHVATTIAIAFTSGALTSAISGNIVVSPAAADRLSFTVQPSSAQFGSVFGVQPVLETQDPFGNESTVGLPAGLSVVVTLSAGTGPLQGTTALDIGTAAGNGTVTFTDLQIDSIGSDKQLAAGATGLASALSSVFAVSKGDQSITFGGSPNKTYGNAPFSFSATASSGLGVTFIIVSGPATVSGNTVTITGAGSVTVRASQSGDANYNSAPIVDQSFTITPAALTITADDQSKVYGAALPTLSASYLGFVNGDTVASLDTPVSLSTTAASSSDVGAYPIVPSNAADANYTISFVAGTLTVMATALTITVDDKSKVYGAALPVLSASYAGFVNGDTVASLDTPVSLSTTATAASVVGTYPITAGGAADANYTISSVAGTLTVTPAGLTITADDRSKVYGAALPALSVSYSGFVNGDTVASLTTSVSLSTTATAASAVGTYPITASGAADANYTIGFVSATLSVTSSPLLIITSNNQFKVYGAPLPTLSASYSGFVNGDTPASLTTPISLSTSATASSPVGSYSIAASGATDPNYDVSFVNGTLSVTSAPLIITADDQSKLYGATVPALSARYSGFVNGDTSASLTTPVNLSTTATASSTVGTYSITASGAADANYTISFVVGTLTVTPAALTITADDQSKVYGTALPAFSASYSGFVNGDTVASLDTPVSLSTTTTAVSNVGTYSITASGAADANYTISFVAGTLTVTPAGLTITADDKSKVYGVALPALSVSYSGFVNGDTASDLDTPVGLSTTATAASAVGTYPITASGAADANYTIGFVSATLSVTSSPLLIITSNNQFKVYGAPLPTLSASYSGFVNGDTPASLTTPVSLSTSATASSPVGSYSIAASGATDPNYDVSFVNGTLSVTSAPLIITADDQSKLYGATVPALSASYSGFVNGDTSASLTTPASLSSSVIVSSPVGSYSIVASAATDPNYSISFVNGTLSVASVPLTITADDQSKLYGAALPTLAASYSGFVNGDTMASLDTAVSLSTTATAGSNVGIYSITASGAADANYTISFVAGTLTVTPAGLTITADDESKVYGAALLALTASYSGFVNGDTVASLDTPVSLTTTATAASAVGTYPISASGAADANYTISFVAGALTMTPAGLTITADDNSTVYGAALPALTASYSGLVNGDAMNDLDTPLTLSTAATAGSAVGTYRITASGAADANYTISFVAGTMTVTPAGLTISADDKSKAYGTALPALTASYSGFVNGDTEASLDTPVSLTTTATAASAVGTYPITASGAADANYTMSFVAGTFTVTPAGLTITTDDKAKVYGTSLPVFSASYSGFVNGDTASDLDTPVSLSTTATAASAVGTYPITASGAADANYTIGFVSGMVSLTSAPLSITANNQSKLYGAPLPLLSASYAGFVNGDTPASLTTPVSLTTSASASSPVGLYSIVAGGATASNYTIGFVNGTLNVTTAPLITVSITSPANGAILPASTQITITVAASGSGSSITKVEFFEGATQLGEASTSPYSIPWNNVVPGNYTLTAKATDTQGATAMSSPVNITVNSPPTVSLNSPANGAAYIAPATISLNATASDSDGSISKVDFYNSTNLLSAATLSPYNFIWNDIAAGNYALTAVATDNAGATATSAVVNVTVDVLPMVSISDATVTEGDSGMGSAVFTVSLSSASLQTITVDYATSNGTAIGGSDFTAVNGTLSFSPGQTNRTITVPVLGDMLDESDETFLVNLSNAVNAGISVGQGIGTILDDDLAPSVLITDAMVSEGNSGTTAHLVFQVRLSTASGKTVSVDYATANGTATAGNDYQPANGTLTFPPGTTLQTVTVTVNGDALVEPDETVLVNLSNVANATIGRGQGVGTIKNDEELPSLAVTDASVAEGNSGTTNAVFTVLLSIASSQTVTVDFATADATATAGSDYIAIFGTLSFPPGMTTTNVSVQIIGDTVQESNEVFIVRLTNAVNATIARGQGQGAIRNDDNANAAPTVSITSPANGATFNDPATIAITAVANDTDGSIAKVEFFQGNIKLGETSASPYSFAWSNVAAGNYTVTARATDNLGATATSGPVDVVVKQAGNLPPVVTITSPENRATFPPGSSVTITATATDSDGLIGRVEFYAGSTLLGTATTAPYTFIWDNVQVGDYSLTAKAFDNRGAPGTSDPVNIAVSQASGDVAIVQNFSDPEITKLQDYLFEMGLSSHVFDQEGLTFQALQKFKLIIWDDLGHLTRGLTDNDVSVFARAFSNGIPLYFIGESLASSMVNLSRTLRAQWTGLVHLNPAISKGDNGTITVLNTAQQNPFLNGRFGIVNDFAYPPRLDLSRVADAGGEVFGQSDSSDVLVASPAIEQGDTGQTRTFTQNVRVFSGTDAASLQARKVLFQNSVKWLVRGPTCGAIDLRLDTSASTTPVKVGSELIYTLVIQQTGECEGTGMVITNWLSPGVRFVSAESTQGSWQYTNGVVTFHYGRVISASVAEMKIIVTPTQPGVITNFAAVQLNGPEVTLDNNSSLLVTEVTGVAQPVLAIARIDSGSTEIELQGTVGKSYVIEASTNLVDWISVTNVFTTDSIVHFFDHGLSNLKARYYRASQRL